MTFKRELRYYIVKVKDVAEYLLPQEQEQLKRLLQIIRMGRSADGKNLLDAVVVEADWPMYEATWTAIEAEVNRRAQEE